MSKTFVAILAMYFIFVIGNDPAEKRAVIQPAQTLSPDMMNLLSTAKKYTNYQGTLSLPHVSEVSQKKLEEMYCNNRPRCPVSALYFQGQIFYSDHLDMEDLLSRSILLHEFVHHVQNERHGDTYDCDMWKAKELEAYKIQAQYLRKHGYNDQIIRDTVKTLKCPI